MPPPPPELERRGGGKYSKKGKGVEVVTSSRSFKEKRKRLKMPEQSNDYRIIVFGAGSVG